MDTRELVEDIKARPEHYGAELVRLAETWERAHARLEMALENLAELYDYVERPDGLR